MSGRRSITRAVWALKSRCLSWRSPELTRFGFAASPAGCYSDLYHIQGLVPHPSPVVYGNEGAGIVETVGPDISGVKVGDHVLSSNVPSCGRCYYCTLRRYRRPPSWRILMPHYRGGGPPDQEFGRKATSTSGDVAELRCLTGLEDGSGGAGDSSAVLRRSMSSSTVDKSFERNGSWPIARDSVLPARY